MLIPEITALAVLFLLMMLPAIIPTLIFIQNLFLSILCKEFCIKKEISAHEYSLFVKYMMHEDFQLLRKIVVKDIYIDNIIEIFDLHHKETSYGVISSSLTNIIKVVPTKSDKIIECVINLSSKNRGPGISLLFNFALRCEDMDVNIKKLYVAIRKLDDSDQHFTKAFEAKFKHHPVIEKIISLS